MRQLKIIQKITNRESESLDRYLSEISAIALLTPDEEAELAKRVREGDQVALQHLVRANLRFVVSVAKQYQNNSLTLGDLINEGNAGLIKAAQRFDETRGFKFISYAVWWIRQSIVQAMTDNSRVVRLPLNRVTSIRAMQKAVSDLEQQHERTPTLQEMADVLDLTPEEVAGNMRVSQSQVSIDAPFANNEQGSFADVLENKNAESPDADLMNESLKMQITTVLSTLSDQEAMILVSSYGLNGSSPRTLQEIGDHIGLTSERVRQIRRVAINKLRHHSRSRTLRDFLNN